MGDGKDGCSEQRKEEHINHRLWCKIKTGGVRKSILFHTVNNHNKDGGACSSLMVTYCFALEPRILEKQEENRQLNTKGVG